MWTLFLRLCGWTFSEKGLLLKRIWIFTFLGGRLHLPGGLSIQGDCRFYCRPLNNFSWVIGQNVLWPIPTFVVFRWEPTSMCHFFCLYVCPSVCCTPYLSNCTSCAHNFWYTCVKCWYLQVFFFPFFKAFYFSGC